MQQQKPSITRHTLRALPRYLVFLALVLVVPTASYATPPRQATTATRSVRLPLVPNNHPWSAPYGIQAEPTLGTQTALLNKAVTLGIRWVRVGSISWRDIQPTEGGPLNWRSARTLEQTLRSLAKAGIKAEVIVFGWPRWASINQPYPTLCGAIRADKLGAFATFMRAVAQRYSTPEYNVHDWEIGNEPDVDPGLVAPDNGFGCWGKISDPLYGGRAYGEMLKVVTPAIKAADPRARVWVGGLLLANPNTTTAGQGKPEKFFEGILASGAGNSFDIVPYHTYPSYPDTQTDYDLVGGTWNSYGGWTVGKARYLRQLMAQYGVSKPIYLNEGSLLCTPPYAHCEPPTTTFFEAQADYVVRMFTRAWADGVDAVFWYTFEGPGWRNSALLDANQQPRPAYYAYQHYIRRTQQSNRPLAINEYGASVEAYRFNKPGAVVDVLWSRDTTPDLIVVPAAQYVNAYNRDGQLLGASPTAGVVAVTVGFSPVFIERAP